MAILVMLRGSHLGKIEISANIYLLEDYKDTQEHIYIYICSYILFKGINIINIDY